MEQRECPPDDHTVYVGKERRKSCEFANDAADNAVKKTFAILGVNIDNPHEVEQFRISLRFSEELRKVADKGKLVATTVIIGTMITGTITAVVVSFKHYMGILK